MLMISFSLIIWSFHGIENFLWFLLSTKLLPLYCPRHLLKSPLLAAPVLFWMQHLSNGDFCFTLSPVEKPAWIFSLSDLQILAEILVRTHCNWYSLLFLSIVPQAAKAKDYSSCMIIVWVSIVNSVKFFLCCIFAIWKFTCLQHWISS